MKLLIEARQVSCVRSLVAGALLAAGAGSVFLPSHPVRAANQAPQTDSQGSPAETASGGACDQTTQAATKACHFNAQGDFWISVGTCDNLSDASKRATCKKKADADLKPAASDCQAQTDARQQVCQGVGQAAYDPVIDPKNFINTITNPFLPTQPGNAYIYSMPHGTDTFFITRKRIQILGVSCVIVHDTSVVSGVTEEDTFDYFAQDRQGNVWYFGEDTTQLNDGVVVGVEGSWRAGVNGAKPGIIMKAVPKVGDEYRQEFALGTAEDSAKVVALNQEVHVTFGSFKNALKTFEFSGLEPTARENKYYVPGVGNVLTVDLVTGERDELIKIEHK